MRAVFLGDSYTSGWNGYGTGARGWPSIVSRALGWRPRNLAVPGTGFLNPGWTGQPVRTRVGATVAAHPRVVILAAGHNDRRYGARAAGLASNAVIDRLRTALPHALLVVIGPIWQDGHPPVSLRGLRDRLRREAAAVGAVFIDPLGDGWFAGSAHRLISADGIHPVDAGHRRIARLVLAALTARTSDTGVGSRATSRVAGSPGRSAVSHATSVAPTSPSDPSGQPSRSGCAETLGVRPGS